MAENSLTTPEGFTDLLPEDAAAQRRVEASVVAHFSRWGYDEVIPSSCEYYHTLLLGAGMPVEEAVFKLFDHRGRILALRADVTTSVARLHATKLGRSPLPVRLCYRSQVFRNGAGQPRPCESTQAGAELIGAAGPEADAEVISVALEALAAAGLREYRVGVGHQGLLGAVLAAAGLGGAAAAAAHRALQRKDLVSLEGLTGRDSLLWRLAAQPGARSAREWLEALGAELGAEGRPFLDELAAVFGILEATGVGDRVYLDPGIVRELGYYTGVVFDIYAPPVGWSLGGGGRYDGLLATFGCAQPATGFSLELPAVLAALAAQIQTSALPAKDYYLIPEPGRRPAAFACAARLRQQGFRAAVELLDRGLEASLDYARHHGYARALVVTAGGYRELPLTTPAPASPAAAGWPAGIH